MKLQTQILWGYGVVFTLMTLIAAITYQGFASLSDPVNTLAHTQQVIAQSYKVQKLLLDMETGQRGFLITGLDEFLEPYQDGNLEYQSAIIELEELVSDNPTQLRQIEKIERLVLQWQTQAANPEIMARTQMDSSSSSSSSSFKDIQKTIAAGRGKATMDALRMLLADFIAVEEKLLNERGIASAAIIARSTTALTVGTFLAIVLGMVVMLITTRTILREVGGEPAEIAAITERIAQGDLEVDPGQSRTGIAAAVRKMLIALRQSDAVVQQQDWLKGGLNELTDRMTADLDVHELAECVIQYLAERLNIQIGAFYIREPQTDMLLLMGTYAFTRRKGLNDRIKIGQGLVGEAARTRKMISVSKLPKDYTRISSAIGDVRPVNTVVLPLVFIGETKGVIKLGSVKEIPDIALEFLTSIANPIAIGINATQARIELSTANESLQAKTLRLINSEQELKQQSEELKVSNEDLQEQTLRLTDSEKRLQNQSEALKASYEELEKKQAALQAQSTYLAASKQHLETQADELSMASRYKSEFLANMSHELRTPLNSLLILSKILMDNSEGNLTDKQVESAGIIYSGGNELLELINDILDLSKIEAGEVRLNIEKVDLADIEQTILDQFKHQALDKAFEFSVEFATDLPASIKSDQQRILQIIKNLLSNAFKFTHQGEVVLRAFLPNADTHFKRTDLSADNSIGFSINDTGIGISEDKQQCIFEAFKQVDGSNGRGYGGTGLGLSISKNLCDLLHGEIQLKSQPGEGSTFVVYLPIQNEGKQYENENPAQSPLPITPPALPALKRDIDSSNLVADPSTTAVTASNDTPLNDEIPFFIPDDRDVITAASRSVLIVEDDRDFASVLKGIAHQKDYSCLVAGTGQVALQMAKKYSPSAILLDLGLPDIDGLKLLDLLKYDLNIRHIPVHVITGRESMGESLTRGAVGFLHKPTCVDELNNVFAIFDHYLSDNNKRILLIEDDKHYRNSLITLLAHKDVKIIEAVNGKEGLKQLQENDFDCVILDMGLPDISGAEILKQLAQFKKKPLPPIILNTGKELSEELFKELHQYTEEIIIKGTVSAERLLDEVTLFLHQAEANLPANQRKTLQMLHDETIVLKGHTILMVDDDLRNTFALSNLLENYGLDVIVAENGQKALDYLAQHPEIELVLMDIMMPVMDGFEAMKKIRAQKQYINLPIIALTAKAMAEDKIRCIEAGATDYMNKPIDTDKLLTLIKMTIH